METTLLLTSDMFIYWARLWALNCFFKTPSSGHLGNCICLHFSTCHCRLFKTVLLWLSLALFSLLNIITENVRNYCSIRVISENWFLASQKLDIVCCIIHIIFQRLLMIIIACGSLFSFCSGQANLSCCTRVWNPDNIYIHTFEWFSVQHSRETKVVLKPQK